jgi:hypothetical protein
MSFIYFILLRQRGSICHNYMVFVKTSYGTQKCYKCHFLEYKEDWLELVFEIPVLPTTSGYIYKMLLVRASDNKGSGLFIS